MDVEILPQIDLTNVKVDGPPSLDVAKAIGNACAEYGLFYVVNHGIEVQLQSEVFEKLRQFFQLPLEKKNEIHRGNSFRGYFKKDEEYSIEDGKVEWKEGVYYFRDFTKKLEGTPEEIFSGLNPWPREDYVPTFQRAILTYFTRTQELANNLLTCIALSLGLKGDFFTQKFTAEPMAQLGMFHYPPLPHLEGCQEVRGAGRHTDYGGITILLQDDVGGLQAEVKDGTWIDVPPIPGSLVVNLGDMVEIWTNGAFRAAPHRVKVSTARDRFSVAMFYDPGFDCIISPIPLDRSTLALQNTATFKPSVDVPVRYGDYIFKKYANLIQ